MKVLEKLIECTQQPIKLDNIFALAFSTTAVKPSAEYVWGASVCKLDGKKAKSYFFGWPPDSSLAYDNVPGWDVNNNSTILEFGAQLRSMLFGSSDVPEKVYFVGSMALTWLKPIIEELIEKPGFSWFPKYEVIDINQLASVGEHPLAKRFKEEYIIGKALPDSTFPARFGINKLAAMFGISPASGKLPEWKAETIATVAAKTLDKDVVFEESQNS